MQLTQRDKTLLQILFIVILGAVLYFFLYKPLFDEKRELKNEVKELQKEYDSFKELIGKKEKILLDIKGVKLELQQKDQWLPIYVSEEDIIWSLDQMEKNIGIEFGEMSFSPITLLNEEKKENNVEKVDEQTVISQLYQMIGENQEKLDKTTNNDTKIIEEVVVPKYQGFKRSIDTSFSCTYQQLKSLLLFIRDFQNLISIEGISISNGIEKQDINVNLTLGFYGMNNPEKLYQPYFYKGSQNGKLDVFEFYEGYEPGDLENMVKKDSEISQNKNQNNVYKSQKQYDFFVLLKPISADLPTISMGKEGDKTGESYIYSDQNKIDTAEFIVKKEGEKYYYRYKTSDQSYPADDKKWKAFEPANDRIKMIVSSREREDKKDHSGVDLTIDNRTDTVLEVYIFNDEKENPRFHLKEKKGKVKIVNN